MEVWFGSDDEIPDFKHGSLVQKTKKMIFPDFNCRFLSPFHFPWRNCPFLHGNYHRMGTWIWGMFGTTGPAMWGFGSWGEKMGTMGWCFNNDVLYTQQRNSNSNSCCFRNCLDLICFFFNGVFDGEYIYMYMISLPLGLQVIMFKQHLWIADFCPIQSWLGITTWMIPEQCFGNIWLGQICILVSQQIFVQKGMKMLSRILGNCPLPEVLIYPDENSIPWVCKMIFVLFHGNFVVLGPFFYCLHQTAYRFRRQIMILRFHMGFSNLQWSFSEPSLSIPLLY